MATKTQGLTVPQTIEWLLRLGRPPLPECPIEAAKQGKDPKQPCFLDGKYLKTVNWKQWQDTQPIPEILDAWFSNPKTGIGTLGGWNGKHWLGWIDFDQKNFPSPDECDRTIQEWLETHPILEAAPMFRTPSGGYRFLVAFSQEPENFKANSGFSLEPDGGNHVGELLSKNGGHTLLPPTVGVTGKAYEWVRWSEYPPEVDQPEDVGVYPVVKTTNNKQPSNFQLPTTNGSSQIDELLEQIYSRLTPEIVFTWPGHNFKEDRSGKLKGCCPWHDSKSGTAFYTEFFQGQLVWRCPACNIGGGAIAYRHRLVGGNGSPRGREFVKVVRELAQDVGLSLPETTRVDQSPHVAPAPRTNGHNTLGVASQPKKGLETLIPYIEDLIDQGLSNSELEIKLWDLAQDFDRKPRELRELYELRLQEQNRQLDLLEDADNFDQLSKFQNFTQTFAWKDYLPFPLYKGLSTKAEASRIDLIFLIQHLLPAIGGLIGGKLGVVCQEGATEADHWIEYPIIWSAIVAPPSSGKTNAERTIFNPLRNLQDKESKRYEESKREYLQLLEDWSHKSKEEKKELRGTLDDPDYFKEVETGHCRKFLIDEGEIEAVKRRISEQDALVGLTWNSGEFLRIWNSLDQYKRGKGSARQFLLDAWSGRLRGSVDRVNENDSFRFNGQTLSLCGGIQPEPAAKFFNQEGNNSDDDGLWSRMLLAVAQFHPEFDKWSDTRVDLDGLLTELCSKVLRTPGGLVYLAPEAQKLWKRQWEAYRRGYRSYLQKNPAFSYFLGKMCSNLMRIALLVHTLEHCYEPKLNFQCLEADTFGKAVKVANYYIAQFRLCQMQMTQSPEEGLSEFLMQILNFCLEAGTLTPRQVVNKWRRRGKHGKAGSMTSAEVKELFKAIATAKPELVRFDGKVLSKVKPGIPGKKVEYAPDRTFLEEKQRNNGSSGSLLDHPGISGKKVVYKCDQSDRASKPLQNGHSSQLCDHAIALSYTENPKNDPKCVQKSDRTITLSAETPVVEAKKSAIALITNDRTDHTFSGNSSLLEQGSELENTPVNGIQQPEALELHEVEANSESAIASIALDRTLSEPQEKVRSKTLERSHFDHKNEILGEKVEFWRVGDTIRLLKATPRHEELVGRLGTVQEVTFSGLRVKLGKTLLTCQPDQVSRLTPAETEPVPPAKSYAGNNRPKVGDRLLNIYGKKGTVTAITSSSAAKYEVTWEDGKVAGYDFEDLQTLGVTYER